MLEFDGINYWAVAVVWFIYVIIGSFWYSPAGFGKRWTKYTGIDILKIPENEATKTIGFVAFSAMLQVFALALIINSLQITQLVDGLLIGIIVWLGLTAATTVGTALYQRLGWKFWWLNSSYFLLVMLIGAGILAVWQ